MAHEIVLGEDGTLQTYSGGSIDLGNLQRTTLVDSTTGVAATRTAAAGVGVVLLPLFTALVDITAADFLTSYTPGFRFKILSMAFAVDKPATTAAKLATLTPKISGVAVTGGVVALTSANCTPQGAVVAGSAVTALNTGLATDTISITGSAVTAFVEGNGSILLRIQNMDTADAIAGIFDMLQKN